MAIARHGYVTLADNTPSELRVNRQGGLVTIDQYAQWIMEGRVFCSSDADGDDIVAAIAGFVATTPQLLLQVPSGTTAVPLWISAGQNGTVEAGATGHFTIMYDGIDRYSSGGTSETVTNMRTDDPYANKCLLYSTPTAAAADAARVLLSQQYETDDGTAGTTNANLYWSARHHFSPYLVGPASIILWIDDVASTPEFAWSVGWAEFPTADAT